MFFTVCVSVLFTMSYFSLMNICPSSSDPSGALKSYLRELPEPIMTFDLYEEWIQASK